MLRLCVVVLRLCRCVEVQMVEVVLLCVVVCCSVEVVCRCVEVVLLLC